MEIKDALMQELAKNIKKARKEKNISQMVLSERADISQSYLGNIEIGKYCPSLETLLKIALALEINPGDLFPKPFTQASKKYSLQQAINILEELKNESE